MLRRCKTKVQLMEMLILNSNRYLMIAMKINLIRSTFLLKVKAFQILIKDAVWFLMINVQFEKQSMLLPNLYISRLTELENSIEFGYSKDLRSES